MKKTALNLIALVLLAGTASASEFDLTSFSAADVRSAMADVKAPAPQPQAGDDLVGLDMNVRIPFKTLKKAVNMVAASEKRLTVMDQNAPVIYKSGDFLKIGNIQVDANGIIVNPVLTLKPYLEGRDKFAVRVQRVQIHAAMEPSVKAVAPAIDQEQIMVQVMDVMIKGVYSAVNDFLKKKQIPMKAQDVVKLSYDKTAWTLHAQVSSKIMGQFVPPGLVGDLHLTGFSFNEAGLVITVQTAN